MALLLSAIAERARQRADMQDSGFPSDTVVYGFVTEAYDELWDLVVQLFSDYFVTTSATSALTGGSEANARISLASGLRHLLAVIKDPDTTLRWELPRFDRRLPGGLSYKLEGNYIVIEPYESASGSYAYRYVPGPGAFSSASDTMDDRLDRWADWVVIRAAMKCLIKEGDGEGMLTPLTQELSMLTRQIETAVTRRDASRPPVVPDPDGFGVWDPRIGPRW